MLATTDVAGVPPMVGGVLESTVSDTVMLKEGKDVVSVPSLMLIVILEVTPKSVNVGAP